MKKRRALIALALFALLLGGVGLYVLIRPPAQPPAPPFVVASSPLAVEITPADGAVLTGSEVWVRWAAPFASAGRVRWRKAGEAEFRLAPAAEGDAWVARLDGLEAGAKYEYVVEAGAEDGAPRSAQRSFSIGPGLAFEAAPEFPIRRDYDQTVSLSLRNLGAEKVKVAARALAQFRDLPADAVGPGSVDEPVDLAPGEKLGLTVAVNAADAGRTAYDIPVETNGAFTTVRLRIPQPPLKLTLKVVGEDARTLAKTVEVLNEGEALTDLSIRPAAPHEADLTIRPGTSHAYLPAGRSLRVVVAPVLYLEFASLKADLECRAAGQAVRFPVEFAAPPGQRLLGIRLDPAGHGEAQDWFCTNRPNVCTPVPAGSGNGPVLASAGSLFGSSSDPNCDCDKKKACEAIKEMQALIAWYTNPSNWHPGGFQAFADKLDQLMQKLSEALACRYNQGNDLPPDVEQALQKMRRLRHFKTLTPQSSTPTATDCQKLDKNSTAEDRNRCDDYKAIEEIGNVLGGLAATLGCPQAPKPGGGRPNFRCPDLPSIEDLTKKLNKAKKILEWIKKVAPGEAVQETLQKLIDNVGKIANVLEKVTDLADLCDQLRDFYNALNAVDKAKTPKELAKAFDDLFRTAGVLGSRLPEPYNAPFKVLAENKSFFDDVSSDLIPEERWKDVFKQIDGFEDEQGALPGKPRLVAALGKFLPGEDAPEPTPAGPALIRPGLLEALERRASFTRAHRGPLAFAAAGDDADSSAFAASWYAAARVVFAWHQPPDQIVFAAFERDGKPVGPPMFLGSGRWPRLTADGERVAVVWDAGNRSTARVFSQGRWGDEVTLAGQGAAIAFVRGGPLHAVTGTGLWKLSDGKSFERIGDGAVEQPSLVLDADGKPHVAEKKGGKVVVDGEAVGDGDRPSLLALPGDELRLAYLTKEGVAVRSRAGGRWGDPITIAAKEPAWPALARGGDGEVRLGYVAAAECGPRALWLVRLPDVQPLLVPSLAGNVTEAWLLIDLNLRYARWTYRPHDLLVSVNGSWVKFFPKTIPEGRFAYPLDPAKVFTSSGRPAFNHVQVNTWHLNGGSYSTGTGFHIITRTAWDERFAFAATPQEVLDGAHADPRLNTGKADLVLLANTLALPAAPPQDGRAELAITVANMGEADSAPARLVMLHDDKSLADAEVPALQPGKRETITFLLEGKVPAVAFRLEQAEPDFDPRNDVLSLRLWSERDPTLARSPSGSAVRNLNDDITLSGYRHMVGKTLLFVVTGRDRPPVWGTDVYTDDSWLGTAAVHAGVVRVGERKLVRVKVLPGRQQYRGSTRNGVTTQPYGSWGGSYRFEGVTSDKPLDLDLTDWKQEGRKQSGQWEVSPDGASVVQKRNGDPTFFVSPDAFRDVTIKGKLKVETTDDDDYIGFVFGYQAPLEDKGDKENQYDFLLLDWKKADQEATKEGFALVRVRGAFSKPEQGFWDRKESDKFAVLKTQFGKGKGWKANREHEFELRYEARRIVVRVDGELIFDVAAKEGEPDFPAGRFGFYNYSQAEVRYSGFTAQTGPPPGK